MTRGELIVAGLVAGLLAKVVAPLVTRTTGIAVS